MSSAPKFFTSSIVDDETGVQLQIVTVPASVVKQCVGEQDLTALLQTTAAAISLTTSPVERGPGLPTEVRGEISTSGVQESARGTKTKAEAAVANVARPSGLVPVTNIGESVAILVDAELPRSLVTGLQSRKDYFAQRRKISSGIASKLLNESSIVLERSPLKVDDFTQVLSQISAAGAAYSIDLKDGPVVVAEHVGNIIITAVAVGAATGLRKGISDLVIRLLNLPRIGRRR